MEHYKYNMAECCHAGIWQEDIMGKTCLDCGFNTYHNDCGMYDNSETKGIVTRINEEMERTDGPTLLVLGRNPKMEAWYLMEEMHKRFAAPGFVYPDFSLSEDLKKQFEKRVEDFIKPEQVFKIEAQPFTEEEKRAQEELYVFEDTDPLKLDGTKQKKFRKGNNKKYFRRKRK